VAILLAALVGCGGDGRPANQQVSHHHETASEAWEGLRQKSMWGQGLTMAGFGQVGGPLQQAEVDAKREADRAMRGGLPLQALNDMADAIARQLSQALPQIPEIKNAPSQVVLAFSDTIDVANAGGRAGRNVNSVLRSVRMKLLHDESMSNNFVFVGSSESDASKIIDRLAGKDTSMFRDPLQRTADTTHAVVYDPQTLYLVSGAMDGSNDEVNHTIEVQLTLDFIHVRTRRTLDTMEFRRKYMWHPNDKKWELQP
jgi:hypothetical protein